MTRLFVLSALCLSFLSSCGVLNNRDIHTQIISNPPGASIYVVGSYEGIAPLTLSYVIDESKYDFMRIGRVEARWRSGARASVTPRLSTSNSYPKVILNRPAKAEGLEKDLEYVREREEALAEAELQKEIAREYARQARSESQRKARVNCTRSNVASTLCMHELTYFLGYTAITGSATLRSVFADLTHTLASTRARFEAVGKAEGSRASGRSVEEYMVALFLTGAVGSGLHQDDIAIQHLTRVLELADDYAGDASITVDPYYVPFAKFELGMLHLRGGRPKMAVCMFEESRKQTDFTFGQALWYRSQGPLAEAKKQVK